MNNKRGPNPVDAHVGSRIRTQRLLLRISQEKLAEGLGITFQQVQKYEKGTNRVGASRLQQIALLLGVPISYFFADAVTGAQLGKAPLPEEDAVTAFLSSREGIELNRAFQQVQNVKVRQNILQLVKSLGDASDLGANGDIAGATA